jgi:hypothetical protein
MLAAIKAKNKDLPGAEQVLKQAAQAKPESEFLQSGKADTAVAVRSVA